MKPTTICTRRLILRRACHQDSECLFRNYLSDSDSALFLTRKAYICVDQAKEFLTKWCDLPWDNELDKFAWVIAFAETNEAIGVFLVELDDTHAVQIHYGISRSYARQGLITEAGREVVQWLTKQKNLRRIWAACDLSNLASRRTLEKMGFYCKGIHKKKLKLPAFNNAERECYLYTYDILK